MRKAKRGNPSRILFVPSGTIISASTRYRVYQYLEPLRREGFQVEVLQYPEPPTLLRRLIYFARLLFIARRVDIIFIQKRLFPRFLPLLHRVNPKIIYDFDDALFAGPSSLWLRDLERQNHRIGNVHFDMMLRLSCHIIAGNEYLAAYARRIHTNVTVIPTVVDISRYPVRSVCKPSDAPVTLGWVGNGENLVYLQDIASVFVHLTRRFGNKICLYVISDQQPQMPGIVPLRFQPWRLESEVKDLFAFDIGLMPLRDDDRTRGKCAFKAIQYMALGISTVASPVGVVKELIEHGINGLLALDEEEWIQNLTALIQDAQLRHRLGMAGRKTVIERFSLKVTLPKMINVLKGVMEQDYDL